MERVRLNIYLRKADFEKLNLDAKENYRDVREQAAWVIAQYAKGNLTLRAIDPPLALVGGGDSENSAGN